MQPTNYLLQHIASILAKQSDQVLQEQLGIGLSQFKILQALRATPGMKQRAIADHLGQTEPSISRQVKLMTEQGLLGIRRSPQNRREHITAPTPKGTRLTDAALEILDKYHTPTFARLSDKQHGQMLAILEVLHGQVCAESHQITDTKTPS